MQNILLGHKSGIIRRFLGWYQYRRERKNWHRFENWAHRVEVAQQCPDNSRINRVKNAGSDVDGWISMHNGVLVETGGYYGENGNPLLTKNAGVHEPQEEYLFDEVVKQIQKREEKASMLELGSYWGFYSMSFAKQVINASCYLVEADACNIEVGKRNFEKNGVAGSFLHGFIGQHDESGVSPQIYSVDGLFDKLALDHLTILHADIQSHELSMLHGAKEVLSKNKVDIWFISTHTNYLHYRCKAILENAGYLIPWSIDLVDSYSFDGLIVAHLPDKINSKEISISYRSENLW